MSARLITVTPGLSCAGRRCAGRCRLPRRAVPAGVAGDPRPGSPQPRPRSWTISRSTNLTWACRRMARQPNCGPI